MKPLFTVPLCILFTVSSTNLSASWSPFAAKNLHEAVRNEDEGRFQDFLKASSINDKRDVDVSVVRLLTGAISDDIYTILIKFLQLATTRRLASHSKLCKGLKPSPPIELKKEIQLQQVSAMHVAAMFCREKYTATLLKKGAEVDSTDKYGMTPLFYVTCAPVAAILIDSGAKVTVRSKSEQTPLHLAVNRPIAELLVKKGALINARDKCGNTPLHMAAHHKLVSGSAKSKANKNAGTRNQLESDLVKTLRALSEKLAQSIRAFDERKDVYGFLKEMGATPSENSAGNTPETLRASRSDVDWD